MRGELTVISADFGSGQHVRLTNPVMTPTIDTVAAILERAWAQALPGGEVCARDSVWRELQISIRIEVLSLPPSVVLS